MSAGTLRRRARDDGRGADSEAFGNGLRGMRERLAAYGGSMQVRTAPGEGFALELELPLEAPADHPLTPAGGPVPATGG